MPLEDLAQAKINRGQRARHLLDDPVLNEAFDALLADADTAREATKPGDTEIREECHRAKKAIEALRKKLSGWISDGTIEQMHLDELNAKEKRNAPN
jgi:hypothetical protein